MKIIGHKSDWIKSTIVVDTSTKKLVKRMGKNQIAVICHADLDETAILALIKNKPSAILNFQSTLTGSYPSNGPERLLQAAIPIFDVQDDHVAFHFLIDGMTMEIDPFLLQANVPDIGKSFQLIPITQAYIYDKKQKAMGVFNERFSEFADNSLWYAKQETSALCKSLPILPLKTKIKERTVVVVARGTSVEEDFKTILPFIYQERPIFIGVDGGADTILEFGLTPDIIVGDMDSVSEHALRKVQDLIVHSYPNGKAPGLEYLQELKLAYHILPCVGTSEDASLLLAFEYGAKNIILVGSHSHMVDFLDKGRKGMGSTILTRMKIGHKLIDIKGIHILSTNRKQRLRFGFLVAASIIPLTALVMSSPGIRLLAYALWVELRILLY